MCTLLAYGEFRSFQLWDMFLACLRHGLVIMVPALLLYVVCSVLVEFRATRWFAIPIWCIVCIFFLPAFGVMGAYGPAHVAADVFFPIWPLLFGAIVVKTILHRRCR